jgi:hypothetical protein
MSLESARSAPWARRVDQRKPPRRQIMLEIGSRYAPVTRSCRNNGRIRFLISRSDAAHNASVSSIDAACVHDLRIMVAHGFRNLQKRQL